jgi:hypothetical protein
MHESAAAWKPFRSSIVIPEYVIRVPKSFSFSYKGVISSTPQQYIQNFSLVNTFFNFFRTKKNFCIRENNLKFTVAGLFARGKVL